MILASENCQSAQVLVWLTGWKILRVKIQMRPFRGHCRDEDMYGCRPRSWCQEGPGLQKQQSDSGLSWGRRGAAKKPGRSQEAGPPQTISIWPLHFTDAKKEAQRRAGTWPRSYCNMMAVPDCTPRTQHPKPVLTGNAVPPLT